MDNLLDKVQQFADEAHGDQKRKYTGERYIVHPIRVMNICSEYTTDPVVLAAALLHDVLEDTPVNKPAMSHFLESIMTREDAARTLRLVSALTDVYTKEKFPELNRKRRRFKEAERLKSIQADAQTIKYADIIDNTVDITQNDHDFAVVYLKECMQILRNMANGNQDLYKRALETVEASREKLK